jgi:hypothetical protein
LIELGAGCQEPLHDLVMSLDSGDNQRREAVVVLVRVGLRP